MITTIKFYEPFNYAGAVKNLPNRLTICNSKECVVQKQVPVVKQILSLQGPIYFVELCIKLARMRHSL